MALKIKSIEKGWGENSTFYSTERFVKSSHRVDEIKESWDVIEQKYDPSTGITVVTTRLCYNGYRENELVFHIESGSQLTINYW